jgi:hypothetical protein
MASIKETQIHHRIWLFEFWKEIGFFFNQKENDGLSVEKWNNEKFETFFQRDTGVKEAG